MGLDMYLLADKYVSGSEYREDKNFAEILDLISLDKEDAGTFLTVSVNVGYWRKANAIHSWFVTNVQNGVDNCQLYYVHRNQLVKLKELCNEALAAYSRGDLNSARQLLTPKEGFFFGSVQVDDGYKSDLEQTVQIISKCLTSKFEDFDFYYRSSW